MTPTLDLTDITCVSRDGRMMYSGGVQHIIFFDNGYGASIITGEHTYGGRDGLWELAVIAGAPSDWEIVYTTPITDDVLGHLTNDDVYATLAAIAALEPAGADDDGR